MQSTRLADPFELLNSSLAQSAKELGRLLRQPKTADFLRKSPKPPRRQRVNSLASGCFRGFSEKSRLNALGFVREYLRSCSGYGPSRSVKDAASLLICTQKIFLLGGCGFFVSDVISRGLLGHLGPLCLALGANH